MAVPVRQERLDSCLEFVSTRITVCRRVRQSTFADIDQLLRNGVGIDVFLPGVRKTHHFKECRPPIGRLAGCHGVQKSAEQENIRVNALRRIIPGRHLRRHEDRRSDHTREIRDLRNSGHIHQRRRQPPIQQIDLAKLPNHHVFGLDVTVKNSATMRERHRVANAQKDVQMEAHRVFRRHSGLIAEIGLPAHALNALHDDHWPTGLVLPNHMNWNHVWVLHGPHNARLLKECVFGIARNLPGMHGFDRDVSAQGVLIGEMHQPHAASADFVANLKLGLFFAAKGQQGQRLPQSVAPVQGFAGQGLVQLKLLRRLETKSLEDFVVGLLHGSI